MGQKGDCRKLATQEGQRDHSALSGFGAQAPMSTCVSVCCAVCGAVPQQRRSVDVTVKKGQTPESGNPGIPKHTPKH
eukprot:6160241-Amphidinium_carterae.1